jgi:Ca2+-binding EF-hand superfamily protein
MRVQKDSVPKSQDRLALAEDEVKQLLMLIDTDKKGRISKRELMNFMEAEFERLGKD